MKKITLFSDGDVANNPSSGAYATILEYNAKERVLTGAEPDTTKNRMELLGIIKGLDALSEPCEVELFSTSAYVVKGINVWLDKWKERDFQNVKNLDLWQTYLKVAERHKVHVTKINAHETHAQNERCYSLAHDEAKRMQASLKDKF